MYAGSLTQLIIIVIIFQTSKPFLFTYLRCLRSLQPVLTSNSARRPPVEYTIDFLVASGNFSMGCIRTYTGTNRYNAMFSEVFSVRFLGESLQTVQFKLLEVYRKPLYYHRTAQNSKRSLTWSGRVVRHTTIIIERNTPEQFVSMCITIIVFQNSC